MPIIVLLLLAGLVATYGFWDTLQAVVGSRRRGVAAEALSPDGRRRAPKGGLPCRTLS
jgi:hypothetical protein